MQTLEPPSKDDNWKHNSETDGSQCNGLDVSPHLVFWTSIPEPREARKLLACVFPLLPFQQGLEFPSGSIVQLVFSLKCVPLI